MKLNDNDNEGQKGQGNEKHKKECQSPIENNTRLRRAIQASGHMVKTPSKQTPGAGVGVAFQTRSRQRWFANNTRDDGFSLSSSGLSSVCCVFVRVHVFILSCLFFFFLFFSSMFSSKK